MSVQTAMLMMSIAEVALWAALGLVFWKKALQHRFPTMSRYLALRISTMPLLFIFYYGASYHWQNCARLYFIAYYIVYIASSVCIFFVCMEVFRSAFAGFSGLLRLGTIVFRWTLLASVVMS